LAKVKECFRPLEHPDVKFVVSVENEISAVNKKTKEAIVQICYNQGRPLVFFNKYASGAEGLIESTKRITEEFTSINNIYLDYHDETVYRYSNLVQYLNSVKDSGEIFN
jgi:formyltetrahydrofolate synthetase